MFIPSPENLLCILTDSLNRMDSRLTGHGERVAYWMLLISEKYDIFSPGELSRLLWTVLVHDIGAFRHMELESLMEQEQHEDFSHARYGAMYLKQFWPFKEYIPVVRYHHSGRAEIESARLNRQSDWAARYIQVVDFADLYRVGNPKAGKDELLAALRKQGGRFEPQAVGDFIELTNSRPFMEWEDFNRASHIAMIEALGGSETSENEREQLLNTLVSSVDFRSRSTALHCATVVELSEKLARLFGLEERELAAIRLGALLHDLGKIAIPTRVLEFPGKLSTEDWEIMKSHVMITGELLRDRVDGEVVDIAVRHHETLDGKGYPLGLSAKDLTLPQRIVAVADIVSALSEERAYKPAFPLEKVFDIIEDMSRQGRLCNQVVELLLENRQDFYDAAHQVARQADGKYQTIMREYNESE